MALEQEELKCIGADVERWRAKVRVGHPSVYIYDRQFLYDLLFSTIVERDEARKLCADYRDTYGGGPKDPLPWENP